MTELRCRSRAAGFRAVAMSSLRWAASAAIALVLGLPAGDVHAQSAGQAVAVSGSVSASGPQGVRALVAGGPVYMGDTIDTGVFGEAQIVFSDDTRLAIGPGSQMVLDSYVLQTRSTTSSFVINAARGAFRFISGGSRSNAYQVTTPTAIIGIRGTAFDVSDRTTRRTNALLYDGRITACNVAGQCADLALLRGRRHPRRSGPAGAALDTSQLVPTAVRYQFPYLVDEARLLPEFQVQAARCLGAGGPTDPIRGTFGGEGSGAQEKEQAGATTATREATARPVATAKRAVTVDRWRRRDRG
jgi:hypothetical protein